MVEQTLKFSITLKNQEWALISQEQSKVYTRFNYFIVIPTQRIRTFFSRHINIKTQKPCSVVYKYLKKFKNGNHYFFGHCIHCESKFQGTVKNPANNKFVLLRCSFTGNFDNCNISIT